MVRVTLCLELLLLLLAPKQSDAVSGGSSELLGEKTSSATETTKPLLENQERAGQCLEYLTKHCHTVQPTSMTPKELEAVNNALNSTKDVVTETANLLYQKVQRLQEKQLQLNNSDLHTALDYLKQTVRQLCGEPRDVCWELIEALEDEDVNKAKILLKCNNDSCILADWHCNTPLTFAACNGRVDWLEVLLEGGANVESSDTGMMTALHYAASGGHVDMCRLLLDWGANVDTVDDSKNTPLHVAAENGKLSVVKLLVERVADVSLKNEDGQTASDLAREAGYKHVAEWLDSKQNHTIQDTCPKHKDQEAVNSDIRTQIQFIEEELNRNTEEQNELRTAISRLTGILNQMEHGLFDKTDVVCGYLFEAVNYGDVNIAKNLFNYTERTCVSRDGLLNTPLTFAASKGLVELVRVFLEGGANVEAADVHMNTALHFATSGGHLDMCRLLLNRGANVTRVNNLKNTPLHLAAQNGHLLVVKLLVEKRADIRVKNEEGLTARHVARRKGYKNIADWLDWKSCG